MRAYHFCILYILDCSSGPDGRSMFAMYKKKGFPAWSGGGVGSHFFFNDNFLLLCLSGPLASRPWTIGWCGLAAEY
jgi:hypothetical protein